MSSGRSIFAQDLVSTSPSMPRSAGPRLLHLAHRTEQRDALFKANVIVAS